MYPAIQNPLLRLLFFFFFFFLFRYPTNTVKTRKCQKQGNKNHTWQLHRSHVVNLKNNPKLHPSHSKSISLLCFSRSGPSTSPLLKPLIGNPQSPSTIKSLSRSQFLAFSLALTELLSQFLTFSCHSRPYLTLLRGSVYCKFVTTVYFFGWINVGLSKLASDSDLHKLWISLDCCLLVNI